MIVSALARICQKIALAVAMAGVSACSEAETRYTGLWKTDCDDYWAVQIRPQNSGLYAVTFCGLSGCLQPGTWMPDTRIVDDPRYEVVSPKKIRIKRPDGGHYTYARCAVDPFWRAAPLTTTNSGAAEEAR